MKVLLLERDRMVEVKDRQDIQKELEDIFEVDMREHDILDNLLEAAGVKYEAAEDGTLGHRKNRILPPGWLEHTIIPQSNI